MKKAGIIVLFALLFSACSEKEQANFIVFLVDDLGWADVACNNPQTFYETPNVDKMANLGIRYTDAYASCPVCSPTRASIMTGKSPARLNITDWIPGQDPKNRRLLGTQDLHSLPFDEITLAEALAG
ncbi:MAG: sulfatase-like hydrolase/transferase, partial [Bacteroidetes bacterium]|nr:sulfatase-like hydrolase/transferase [Bacteroidota bacterium]